jgi:four helix bundle protein
MFYQEEKAYKQLLVYQRMMELVVVVYELTKTLPNEEKFGLVSQMRRAVISVLSNFVEGYLKRSVQHKQLFLENAQTSLFELEAQADVCTHLNFWGKREFETFTDKCSEAGYLLHRYRLKVK